MTIEFDSKGKIFTDVVSKALVPALIQTTTHLIKGNMHVRRDERLKNELDRDELFLAVTDASVLGATGEVLHEVRFIAIRRDKIVWVMPTDQDGDQGEENNQL